MGIAIDDVPCCSWLEEGGSGGLSKLRHILVSDHIRELPVIVRVHGAPHHCFASFCCSWLLWKLPSCMTLH